LTLQRLHLNVCAWLGSGRRSWLAGPNGAGKSTLADRLLVRVLRGSEFVDADVLARGLPRSETAAVTAGRAVLRRLDELATGRRSFGFATTLASRSFAPRIRRLILDGYEGSS